MRMEALASKAPVPRVGGVARLTMTVFRLVQPLKALLPMAETPSVMTTRVILSLRNAQGAVPGS